MTKLGKSFELVRGLFFVRRLVRYSSIVNNNYILLNVLKMNSMS